MAARPSTRPNEPSITAPPKTGAASGVTGAFTKCGLVGKGSFGAVYLVRHTKKGGDTLIMKEVQTNGLSSGEVKATKQEVDRACERRTRHITTPSDSQLHKSVTDNRRHTSATRSSGRPDPSRVCWLLGRGSA